VMGIYAKENQQGMVFEPDSEPDSTPPTPPSGNKNSSPSQTRPSLKVVK